MNNITYTPISNLSCYLSSGKTTLMNHLLNNRKDYKAVVILNNMSKININLDLIKKDRKFLRQKKVFV